MKRRRKYRNRRLRRLAGLLVTRERFGGDWQWPCAQ